MLLNNFLRITSILLILSLLLPINAFASENTSNNENDTYDCPEEVSEIDSLLDERAKVLCKIFDTETEQSQNTLISELNEKDLALARLGVDFLTSDEVNAQFPETPLITDLSLTENNLIQPTANVPDSDIETWISFRGTYTKNGTSYDIQTLTAQPCHPSSLLTHIGSKVTTYGKNWRAGAIDAISVVGQSVLEGAVEHIPGANLVISFLSAVNAFFSGIDSSTTVNVPNIVHSWSSVTTVIFYYVKEEDNSDDYQRLSLVTNKENTAVGYQIPRFTYKNNNGLPVLTPTIVQNSYDMVFVPTKYNNPYFAITCYHDTAGFPIQNCISYVKIYGPEGELVHRFMPCSPYAPIF